MQNLSFYERSKYFKGLLILIGKDKIVSKIEKDVIIQVGKTLGFNEEFCDESVGSILDNEFIKKDPPVFSDQQIAESFVRDGLRIASSTGDNMDIEEIKWLETVSEENGLGKEWFELQLIQFKDYRDLDFQKNLEVKYIMQS